MPAKHLVIGVDGAELSLIEAFGPQRLPNLHRLMARGAHAALASVMPPATLPNWTTFLTGVDPGRHGVFDFTTRTGYSVRFTAGSVREAPTLAARLDRLGKRCACLFFPATFPPERLNNGLFISGWDAPVAFEADESFIWPPQWHQRLVRRFGPQRFGDVDEFDTQAPGWHHRLPEVLCRRVLQRTQLCEYLLDDRDWDLFAVYFGEGDTAAHHLWALHDVDSPRRPPHVTPAEQGGLERVYRALDRAVGELLSAAGGERTEVTLVSDHGFGGASDRVLYLNRVLEEAGLLRFKRRLPWPSVVGAAKEAALTRLPLGMRDRLFRMASASLPGLVESRARYGAIDMDETLVFSDELNYFPALYINLKGREPRGTVSPGDVATLCERVRDVLFAVRDPFNGQQVVADVHTREALYSGPFVDRAPDLLLTLHLCDGYSYNLMPSAAAPPGTGPFRRLAEDEYLGRKGRSLQGSHRPHGVFIAAGPSVAPVGRVRARMADATATVLARMGLSPDPLAAGRALELGPGFSNVVSAARALPAVPVEGAKSEADEARVAARLRRLGYIE